MRDQEGLHTKAGGWDGKQFCAYPSPQGDGSKTIGYGHELSKHEDATKCLSEQEAIELFNKDYELKKKAAAVSYNQKQGCQKGEKLTVICKNFEDLPEYMQHIAIDISFNVIPNRKTHLPEFPNLAKAMHDNSLEGLIEESKTYYHKNGVKVELKRRNDCRSAYINANYKNPIYIEYE